MSLRYLMVLVFLFAPGCSSPATVATTNAGMQELDKEEKKVEKTKPAVKEKVADEAKPESKTEKPEIKDEPAKPELTAEMKAALAAMAKSKEADARLAESKNKFASLNKEFNAANKTFSAARRKVKTREEFDALMKTAPMATMGDQFVEFAKTFEGTNESLLAMRKIAQGGSGETKTEAMNMLLDYAKSNPDTKEAKAAFELLARTGSGEPKKAAMEKLLAVAKSNSENSFKTLSLIALAPGEGEAKTKAIEELMAAVESDPTSERSFDTLHKMAMSRDAVAKAAAMDPLIEHHVNNPKMGQVISTLSRTPTPQAEKWLTQISENAMGTVKANAVIGRIALTSRKKDPDPEQLDALEKMLDTYVKENTTLIARAEKELFALRNLSIGKSAPEIVAADLDGVEFKLSDYRGKVVLLDFWGDW